MENNLQAITVAVRVRPEEFISIPSTRVFGNQIVLIPPTKEELKDISNEESKKYSTKKVRSKSCRRSNVFKYDVVYGPDVKQGQIYEELGKSVVENCLKGFNACIFAYGQTNSGKTHTMMGPNNEVKNLSESELGIIPRLCNDLFSRIEALTLKEQEKSLSKKLTGPSNSKNIKSIYSVKASMIEIYSEQLKDLLAMPERAMLSSRKGVPQKALKIREDPKHGYHIPNLTRVEVKNSSEIQRLIAYGASQRTTAKTKMNDVSSRSHSIFQVKFTKTEEIYNKAGTNILYSTDTVSLVNLIDLAGSEQMGTSISTFDDIRERRIVDHEKREKELISINVSLSSLGLVITKLAKKFSGDKNITHIPYRNSKLTKLLQDSLGGNSKTIMIATISPHPFNYEQTVSTCRYADSVKCIKNRPIVNVDPKDKIISQLRERISSLKKRQLSEEELKILEELKRLNHDMSADLEELKKKNERERKMHLNHNQYLRQKNNMFVKKLSESERIVNVQHNEIKLLKSKLKENERIIKEREESIEVERKKHTSYVEEIKSTTKSMQDSIRKSQNQLEKTKSESEDWKKKYLELRTKYDYLQKKLVGSFETMDIQTKQDQITEDLTNMNSNLLSIEETIDSIWKGIK